ncbi:hypothetical protein EVAR_75983_1 [Eumeta japonica]|uniref:Uncharacterized protein n=1 Tax=Eumeta variegata TaxID=151549 RepID=A0A4C1UAY7_EUMVA|nr:hypothetical protein EVAR_75983_1 [Eumeta japonica]
MRTPTLIPTTSQVPGLYHMPPEVQALHGSTSLQHLHQHAHMQQLAAHMPAYRATSAVVPAAAPLCHHHAARHNTLAYHPAP